MNRRGKMKKHVMISIVLMSVILFALAPMEGWAQLIIGQYEDEAPLRTWNILGLSSAAAIGMGDTRFAYATDCTTALTNPALLTKLPLFTVTANVSYTAAQLFKYSLFNTGVLSTNGNASIGVYALDFGGAAVNINGWGLGINYSILEHYDRPTTNFEYYSEDQLVYTMDFSQEGTLSNLNLSVARQFGQKLALGVGVNFIRGSFEKMWEEHRITPDITISDRKSHDFSGFYLNAGIYFDLTEDFTLGAIFRSPFSKNAESKSLIRNQTPATNTDIKLEVSADSSFDQPLVLGAGFSYTFTENFRVAADLSYLNWSGYKADNFGEELERNFKNILKINLGAEYTHPVSLFGLDFMNPIWIGLSYDPQPMQEPDSHYTYFSFGSGLHFQHFLLDLSTDYGWERGSGNNLLGQRIVLTLSYRL